jgi:hypothetical protein
MSGKKRPLRTTRTGAVSLYQFHNQLQQLVGGSGSGSDWSTPTSSSISTTIPSSVIRGTQRLPVTVQFTEGAVLGLREIFGTYLRHVAAALSNHDSLTQDETIVQSLAEVTADPTATTDNDNMRTAQCGVASSSGNNIQSSSAACSSIQWQTLPRQAQDLLWREVSIATQRGTTTTTYTSTVVKRSKMGALSSSLSSLLSGPMLLPESATIQTTTTTTTTPTEVGTTMMIPTAGNAKSNMSKGTTMGKNQRKKKQRMMIVTKEMELEQERLLMASKLSMVEKQKHKTGNGTDTTL